MENKNFQSTIVTQITQKHKVPCDPPASNLCLTVFKCGLIFLLLFLPLSCRQTTELPLPEIPVDTSISIEEAKTWFEKTYGNALTPNARTAKNDNKKPVWRIAKESKFKKGDPFVVVPLLYENQTKLAAVFDNTGQTDKPEEWQQDHTLIRKLIVFKNKKGENKAVVMYVVPSQQYKRENPQSAKDENFTGILLFKDYDDEDKLLEGWRMENGQVTDVFGGESSGKPKKNGRVMDCFLISYGHWKFVPNARISVEAFGTYVWVEDFVDYYCTGSGGGYFEAQLPSGGGGGGFGSPGITNVYSSEYTNEFMNNYGSLFMNQELNHLLENPSLMESVKNFINRYGASRLRDISFIGSVFCGATGQCISQEEEGILSEDGFFNMYFIVYAMNAALASESTDWRFDYGTTNGKPAVSCEVCSGNAYKHALFRALDAHVFGVSKSQRLGNAHEGGLGSPDPNNPNYNPDVAMDVFNNSKGIDAYNAVPWYWQWAGSGVALYKYMEVINGYYGGGNLEYIKSDGGVPNANEMMVPTNVPGLSPR